MNFITARGLSDAVDLVEGGHLEIFRTEDDEIAARKDYEAYQAARIAHFGAPEDLGVRWIGKEELVKVRTSVCMSKIISVGVFHRNTAWTPISATQQ